jgi:hypothetical protein
MEIVVETLPAVSKCSYDWQFETRRRSRVPECLKRIRSSQPINVDISDSMTWDTCISNEWVKARWPERTIKYISFGRAFAPIDEIPIAQIPYLIVAAKYFDAETIENAL